MQSKIAFAQNSINFGELIEGEISSPGEVDSYKFDATADETLLLRLSDADTLDFSPKLTLKDTLGNELWSSANPKTAEIMILAPFTGTYLVFIADNSGKKTGRYFFSAHISTATNNALQTNFGVPILDTLNIPGEVHAYSFEIQDGINQQSVIIKMSETELSPFTPKIVVFDPSGKKVGTNIDSYSSESIFMPEQAGTYIVWAMEDGGDANGVYRLLVQKSKDPGNTRLVEFGTIIQDTLRQTGELLSYNFDIQDITGNKLILIRMSEVISNEFTPELFVFDPTGNLVVHEVNSKTAEAVLEINQTGSYTVWLMEDGGNTTGAFLFMLHKSNESRHLKETEFGVAIIDTLKQLGALHTYAFEINDGIGQQSVLIRMSDIMKNEFTPEIFVFDPVGNLLVHQVDAHTAEYVFAVSQPGKYMVWLTEDGGDTSGIYRLMVQRSLNPGNVTKAEIGKVVRDTLKQTGAIKTFSLYLDASTSQQSILIRMSEITPKEFTPEMFVFNPKGELIAQKVDSYTAEVTFIGSDAGQYTIWAMEDGGNTTGAFNLNIQGSKTPRYAKDVKFGTFLTDSLTQIGELHTYTFMVGDGAGEQAMIIRMSDLKRDTFTPKISIFDPHGNEIASDVNSVTSEVFFITEQLGKYTVWVMEDGGNATGPYGFIVQKSKNPGNIRFINLGLTVTDSISNYGDIHTYIFGHTGGQAEITLHMTDVNNGPFSPRLYLFNPSGVLLINEAHSNNLQLKATLLEDGVYTLWTTDSYGDNVGPYDLIYDYSGALSVEDESSTIPQVYSLEQNFPNPFNPNTIIQYQLPKSGSVILEIFNIQGQSVRMLIKHEIMDAGLHAVEWDGRDDNGTLVANGLYIYKITAGNYQNAKSMLLLK